MTLTATAICRSALLLLSKSRDAPACPWPSYAEPNNSPVAGLFGATAWLADDALMTDLDSFTEKVLRPLIEAWAAELRGVDLGPQYLRLPLGVMDADNARYDGIAMRCIVVADQPVGDRPVPSRQARYYDISTDEFKDAPCSMAVSFWVHTPDSEARYTTRNGSWVTDYPPNDVRSGKLLDTQYPHGLVAYEHPDFIALWDERRNRHVCLPKPRRPGDLKAALTNLGYA